MQEHKAKCPKCQKLNEHLYLEETNGWMICDNCGEASQVMEFATVVKIPVYTGKQLAEMYGNKY